MALRNVAKRRPTVTRLVVTAPMSKMPPMARDLTGQLLVASPALEDPNFARTVIIILRHDREGGAFGLVLNRPLPALDVEGQLPGWKEWITPPRHIFSGGPVERERAFALGTYAPTRLDSQAPFHGPVIGSLNVVDLDALPAAPEAAPAEMRIFSGYAGWSGGQLESELDESAWFVVDARPSDIFAADPEHLWRDVLKRQRGSLAIFAHFPRERSVN